MKKNNLKKKNDIQTIKKAVSEIAKHYDIKKVLLFGSYANETANDESDVDLLVEFRAEVPSIFEVTGFQEEVKELLNMKVDVVTYPLVKPDLLKIDEKVNIYERS